MKRVQRVLVAILASVLCFSSVTIASAAPKEFPDNYINMSIEQRAQWMNENASPTYYEGRLISKTRDMRYTYEGDTYNDSRDARGGIKFSLATYFTWTVNFLEGTVETYSVTRQEAINYSAVFDVRKDVSSRYINPGNVKLFSTAEFLELYGTTILIHDINLHASGLFSFDGRENAVS